MSVRDTVVERDVWRAEALPGMPASVVLCASVSAILGGLAYGLSPSAVWFALAMLLLLRWAGKGLPERERRWVVGTVGTGMAVRVLAVGALALATDPSRQSFVSLLGDEQYAIERSIWIRNVFVGVPIAPLDFMEAFAKESVYGWTAYHYILAYLHLLVGPAPYGAHLFSVVLFLTGAVALHRQARMSYGPLPALSALITLLFFPSLLLWSISTLKESMFFFFMATALIAIAGVVRANRWYGRLRAVVVVAVAIYVIDMLRSGGFVIAVAGILMGLAAWIGTRRRWIFAIAVTTVLLASPALASRLRLEDRFVAATRQAVYTHLGHWRTPGSNFKLLDREFYLESRGVVVDRLVDSMSTPQRVRFFVRAGLAFVIVPIPWNVVSLRELVLFPQQIVWYALVILAPVGLVTGLRRDSLLTFLLAGTVVAGAAVIAPNSGNVGTLIRHRDMVTPFVVWLSAAGAHALVAWLASRGRVAAAVAVRPAIEPV